MKKINVLQLGRGLNYGGTETVIMNLCKGFAKDENINFMVCTSGGPLESNLKELGIKHYYIPDIGIKNPFNFINIIITLRKIVKKENIDIINSHHRVLTILANIATKFTGVKVVHTAHYLIKKTRLGKFFGENIIAVGENVKNNIVKSTSIELEKIKVIYNGIQINTKKNIREEVFGNSEDFIVLNVSRLSKEKGLDIFLEVAEKVISKNKDIKFYIIGDGDERENIEKMICEKQLNSYVKLVGFKNNVNEYIASADLVVSTSKTEGLPITPLETFSQKKTIVATNVGGTGEIVIDKFNGLLNSMDDVDGIAINILKLAKDTEYINKLQENAYDTVLQKFSVDKMIKEYKRYYISLVEVNK